MSKSETNKKLWHWILLSFCCGFIVFGCGFGLWTWHDMTNVHHQHSSDTEALRASLDETLYIGIPAGLITLALTAIVQWSLSEKKKTNSLDQ